MTTTLVGVPPGTVDLYGRHYYVRQHAKGVLRKVYEAFGFDPLETPAIEYAVTFQGHHGEGESLLFHFNDSMGRPLVLRYDLTVPFCRYVADHPDALIPFKRYQIQPSYRDDAVDKGHFREFIQCDGDVLGVSHLSQDAQIIEMAHAGLDALHIAGFIINVNHRKILAAIAEMCGYESHEGYLLVQRALDAVSKFGEKWVGPKVGNPIYTSKISYILLERGFSQIAIEFAVKLFELEGSFLDRLDCLLVLLKGNPKAKEGIDDLRQIYGYLSAEVKKTVVLDITLARGADYYTGFILEGSIPSIDIGAVLGGGRFDNLLGDLGGENLPAVGMAFGLDRLVVALNELGLVAAIPQTERIIVFAYSEEEVLPALEYVRELRVQGHHVDYMPPGVFSNNEDAMTYADGREFAHFARYVDGGFKLSAVGKR